MSLELLDKLCLCISLECFLEIFLASMIHTDLNPTVIYEPVLGVLSLFKCLFWSLVIVHFIPMSPRLEKLMFAGVFGTRKFCTPWL